MISNRLKQLRKERGLTQEAMAAIMRIPRTAYSQAERGKRDVYADGIKLLCVGLLVSADWLLERDDSFLMR